MRFILNATIPIKCSAGVWLPASARTPRRTLSASASRPACSCPVATCISCAIRSAPDAGGCGGDATSGPGRPAAATAPTGISGTIAPPPVPASIKGIPETLDDRFEDRGCRLQMLAVVAIAVARAVVELFGHLGIARRPRIAGVLVKREAAFVERLADEIEHAADRFLLVVDDVLVADRQVMQRHLPPVMLDQLGRQRIVAGRRFQRIGAIKPVRQVVGKRR